jgi:fumarate hydratase class II
VSKKTIGKPATRTERDAMGDIEVPADALWGAQTERSLKFFRIGADRMPLALVHELVRVKRAAAQVNAELGLLDADKARAIVAAADEALAGRHDAMFPLSVWQTGSGTQTNMNVNEVLARRASQIAAAALHPNDDVNLGQSSNDVFPTAMHLVAVRTLRERVLLALDALVEALDAKATEFAPIVKIGRTHLQDATPLTLGQEFSGYVAQLVAARGGIVAALPALHDLAIGGTAVGTGLNAHPEFGPRVAAALAAETGWPFVVAGNRFAALAGHEALALAHGALKTLAIALTKIANDIRWLASGPRSGLGELSLPANEPGSSIMPGKVNPTQAEALTMVAALVQGHDVSLGIAAASGQFELNVYKPLIAWCFLHSATLLADAMASFDAHCVRGIVAERERIDAQVQRSLMLVTALAPHIGYDRAAQIAKKAHADGSTLREAALALGFVSAKDFDRWVVPGQMLGPRDA